MNAVALAVHKAAIEQRPFDLDSLPPAWTVSAGYQRDTDAATIVHQPDSSRDHRSKGDAALGVCRSFAKGQRAFTITVTATGWPTARGILTNEAFLA